MKPPCGQTPPNHSFRLCRNIYGLIRALHAWFEKLCQSLLTGSFTESLVDYVIFHRIPSKGCAVRLLSADDMILLVMILLPLDHLSQVFPELVWDRPQASLLFFRYWGRSPFKRITFSTEIPHWHFWKNHPHWLLHFHISICLHTFELYLKLHHHDSPPLPNPTCYRELTAVLIYFTITWLNIVYVVHVLNQFVIITPISICWPYWCYDIFGVSSDNPYDSLPSPCYLFEDFLKLDMDWRSGHPPVNDMLLYILGSSLISDIEIDVILPLYWGWVSNLDHLCS